MGSRVRLRWAGGTGAATLDDTPLGRGGEGAVWAVRPDPSVPAPGVPLVAKIYHPDGDAAKATRRAEKIDAMLAAAPASDAVCWPLSAVVDGGRTTGFVMAALPSGTFRTWAQLANPSDRRRNAPAFTVRYALAACRNLAVAFDAVHRAGHAVGDVNESNVFIGADATVRLVDADSAQVRTPSGRVFRCEVGKPEYTAPELIGRPLRDVDRTPASDVFGYAVLVFQLLAGGAHPTDGVPVDVDADPPSVTERIAHRWTPALDPPPGCPLTPPARVPVGALPSRLLPLLAAAFDVSPPRRPTLAQFAATLDDVSAHLTDCGTQPGHSYDRRDGRCGWCAHAATGAPDPWGPPKRPRTRGGDQQALPALSFTTPTATPTTARRAAPRPPQHSVTPAGPINPYGVINPYRAGVAAGSVPPYPPGVPQPAAGPAPKRAPDGRTLLVAPDGQLVPRPSLLTLAARQPLLAANCAWDELPTALKPTPGPRQAGRVSGKAAFTAAAVVAVIAVWLVTAVALRIGAGAMTAHTGLLIGSSVTALMTLVATVTSMVAVGVLAVRHIRRDGVNAVTAMRPADVATYARTAAVYGPALIVAAAAGCALAALAAGWWLVSALLGRRA